MNSNICQYSDETGQMTNMFWHFQESYILSSKIFIAGSLTWMGIKTPENLYPRAGHSAILICGGKDDKEEIAVFGGGDNLGEYFNDCVCFHPQAVDSS